MEQLYEAATIRLRLKRASLINAASVAVIPLPLCKRNSAESHCGIVTPFVRSPQPGGEASRLEETPGGHDVAEPVVEGFVGCDFVETATPDKPHVARVAHLRLVAEKGFCRAQAMLW